MSVLAACWCQAGQARLAPLYCDGRGGLTVTQMLGLPATPLYCVVVCWQARLASCCQTEKGEGDWPAGFEGTAPAAAVLLWTAMESADCQTVTLPQNTLGLPGIHAGHHTTLPHHV